MRDVRIAPIAATAVAIALTVACVVAAVFALMHWRGLPPGGARLRAAQDMKLAAPGLASAPQDDTARERGVKDKWLHSSGWIDRDAGVAHIPIDDAMDLLVSQRGRR
jgi:hypothetical protein